MAKRGQTTMKKIITAFTVIIVLAFGLRAGILLREGITTENVIVVRSIPETLLTAEQRAWLGALEWCESKGDNEAVNWKDKDGTPSYYSFQFKPSTFKAYAEKYGLIKEGMTGQEIMEAMKIHMITSAVVANMILDPAIDWDREFPGCVKKLGWPPNK
jgi:hypothetical protein